MTISKIVFRDLTSTQQYRAIGGIRFYVEGKLYDIGTILTSTTIKGETDKIIATRPSGYNSSPAYYDVINAFDNTKNQLGTYLDHCYTLDNKNFNVTIEFKTPIHSLERIDLVSYYMGNHCLTGEFYIDVYSGDTIVQSYIVMPTLAKSIQTILTPELANRGTLIKSNNEIYSLNEINELTNTYLTEPLIKEDFETYGMINIQPLIEPRTEKGKSMSYQNDLEDGKVYSLNINRLEIPVVEKIEIV